VCGYAVEWLRSCYSSRWRLFRGSSQITRGYYYFCDPDTPFFPGTHNLGSLNWTTTDREGMNPPLGEYQIDALATGRPWRNGSFPFGLPLTVSFGSAECLTDGERLPLPVVSRVLIAGVDSRCWVIPPENTEAIVEVGGSSTQVVAIDATAGVRTGADTTELPFTHPTAGVRFGCESSEPNAFAYGGIRTGCETTDIEEEDISAGVRTGGSAEIGPTPGTDCASAGSGSLGVEYDYTERPSGDDWFRFDYTSGTDYHLSLTFPTGKGLVWIYSGDCSSLTTVDVAGSSGCYDLTVPSGPGTIFVKVAISYLLGTDYSLAIDAGSCP
jgi:hypothetical protein